MFKRLPEAATTPDHAGKHHLHQWLVGVSPTNVRAARRAWLPALGLALIVSTTLLACGSDETQQQSESDRTVPTQEATEPTSRSTPTTSNGTQPAQDDSDSRSTPDVGETREPESATETPEPTAAPTETPEPTPTPAPTLTPTPTPVPHHEFAQFMAPFNENGDLVYRMADDGSDEPIYPFNRIRLGGDGDLNYPHYRHLRHHTEGLLKYPEITGRVLQQAMWEIRNPSAEQIRQQVTDEEKAAGVPT